jgi:hypothetical protein
VASWECTDQAIQPGVTVGGKKEVSHPGMVSVEPGIFKIGSYKHIFLLIRSLQKMWPTADGPILRTTAFIQCLNCLTKVSMREKQIPYGVDNFVLFVDRVSLGSPVRPRTHCIAEAVLEPGILLPQPPKYWDYKLTPHTQFESFFFLGSTRV